MRNGLPGQHRGRGAAPRWSGLVGVAVVSTFTIAGCRMDGVDSDGSVTFTLSAEVRTPSQVNLSWTPHPGPVTDYAVIRTRNGVLAPRGGGPGTQLWDFNLDPSTEYCYIVYAQLFPVGTVGRSNQVCVRTYDTAPWSIEDVGTPTIAAMALDLAGKVHLSYRDATGLDYATNASGRWVRVRVDSAAGPHGGSSITVDASGAIHISYYDDTNGGLKYATNASGSWALSTIQSTGGWASAIAVDGSGRIHIAYSAGSAAGVDRNALWYTRSGAWDETFLSGFSEPIESISLALDGAGKVHIAYAVGGGLCAIRYVTNLSGAWTDAVIDDAALCGTSVAVDAEGRAHIAYMDSFELVHATNATGSWTAASLDRLDWIGGKDVGITLDAAGNVHLSYQDHNADLKYATDASGAWQSYYIDSRGNVGAYNTVKIDAAGTVHITYYDETRGTLKHATGHA